MTAPRFTPSEIAAAAREARAGGSFEDYLRLMAPIWRDRPQSGIFVLHRIPRDRRCPLHGPVTKFHMCKATHPGVCGSVGVAK